MFPHQVHQSKKIEICLEKRFDTDKDPVETRSRCHKPQEAVAGNMSESDWCGEGEEEEV